VLSVLPAYADPRLAYMPSAAVPARGWRWVSAFGGGLAALVSRCSRQARASTRCSSGAGWQPGAEGLLFAPYLAGERTPHADPDARGAFVGLELRHDRGALVRAVLEGVAFGLRDSLELLRALGVAGDRGRASGGGARGRLWLEIVAAVLGLPLELTVIEEGSAYGAAILGAS
jgi:xylulokinase